MEKAWVVMLSVPYEGHSIESVHRTEAGANAEAERLRSDPRNYDVSFFVSEQEVRD